MRLTSSTINPLSLLLNEIPEEGLLLTKMVLARIGNILATGGVIAETHNEALELISYLSNWYENLIKLEEVNGRHILRKMNG